jgi:hypothetical protein
MPINTSKVTNNSLYSLALQKAHVASIQKYDLSLVGGSLRRGPE